jgi:hypothetical protein
MQIDFLKINGVQFVVVIQYDKHSVSHRNSNNNIVSETCKELGITLIDLNKFLPKKEYFRKKTDII